MGSIERREVAAFVVPWLDYHGGPWKTVPADSKHTAFALEERIEVCQSMFSCISMEVRATFTKMDMSGSF